MRKLIGCVLFIYIGLFLVECKNETKNELGELIKMRNQFDRQISKIENSKDSVDNLYKWGIDLHPDSVGVDCVLTENHKMFLKLKEQKLTYFELKIDSIRKLQISVIEKIDSIKEVNSIKN
jgi:hypothetical protein